MGRGERYTNNPAIEGRTLHTHAKRDIDLCMKEASTAFMA